MPPRPSRSRFALDVDGVSVGTLKQFSGLGVEAEIAISPTALAGQESKHVASVRWTPGRATVGFGMGKGMYEWMKEAMDTGGGGRDGTFKTADGNAKLKSSLAFSNARITDITVPRLDGASKDAAWFGVVFSAEQLTWAAGQGETITQRAAPKQKAWLSSNFRIDVGDLPCARVAAIESFTWTCHATSEAPSGERRTGGASAGVVRVPDLVLSIAGADYAAWADAARKWFVDGNHRDSDELKGRLVFLAPNLRDELGAIELSGVGLRRFEHPESVMNGESVERFTVTLYVEAMRFTIEELES